MDKKVFIFGNGNLSFEGFEQYYRNKIIALLDEGGCSFLLCDFRGVDTLVMEYLKDKTPKVTVHHIGERPRYLPDKYKTKVSQWILKGGFESDADRDNHALGSCTHFIAVDFNTNEKRKSGTLRNIEKCLEMGKVEI